MDSLRWWWDFLTKLDEFNKKNGWIVACGVVDFGREMEIYSLFHSVDEEEEDGDECWLPPLAQYIYIYGYIYYSFVLS